MAGPQIQRPTSAYYSGQNGTDRVGGGANGGGSGLVTSFSSHTGLHAIRTISYDSELIYRGNASHTIITDMPTPGTSQTPIQQSTQSTQPAPPSTTQSAARMCNIADTGHPSSDALIIPTVNLQPTHSRTKANVTTTTNSTKIAKSTQLLKSSTRDKEHSIELVDDASQCTNDPRAQDSDDVEQGKARRSSRHRHRPLHRRFFNYVKNFFQRTVTQTDSELEEFDTPARYRPDSLGALSRATRFTEDEIKRIYRGFKAECPTGVIKEETFKVIYSQFFPQGGSCANPTLYAHYIFNTLDQDRSGIVSFEDFVQGFSILSRGSVEEKLRWTFSLYDINGDGFITREEMTDIVTAIYELMGRLPDELPEEEKIKVKVEQLFQKMDINRDGVVTLDEFLEACRTDEAISRSMSVFDSAF